MATVANILIAIGGAPMINSSEAIPTYPTHLPGGVLPNLDPSKEKIKNTPNCQNMAETFSNAYRALLSDLQSTLH